jgi:hypothetical protein
VAAGDSFSTFGPSRTTDALDKARAHLLLPTRTKALNDELMAIFQRWYPGIGEVGGAITICIVGCHRRLKQYGDIVAA